MNNDGCADDEAKCQDEKYDVEDMYIAMEDGSKYDLVTFDPIIDQTYDERRELIESGDYENLLSSKDMYNIAGIYKKETKTYTDEEKEAQ